MALVPVMLRGPDGSVTSAFQLQPVPPFYTQEAPIAGVSGAASTACSACYHTGLAFLPKILLFGMHVHKSCSVATWVASWLSYGISFQSM